MSVTSRGVGHCNMSCDEKYGCAVTELSTLFQRCGKFTSMYVKIELHRCIKMKDYLQFDDTVLARYLHSKVIIGIGKDIFEHDIKENLWKSIQNCEDTHRERTGAVAGEISDKLLVCGGTKNPCGVELIGYQVDEGPSINNNNDSEIPYVRRRKNTYRECCSHVLGPPTYCNTQLPISLFLGHTVTSIGENQVLVIGGVSTLQGDQNWDDAWDDNDEGFGTKSNRVFLGTQKDSQDDVAWDELDTMTHARSHHVAFKMKQSVYVIGGSSSQQCERFDLDEMRWYKSFDIPPTLCCPPHSAVVVADETMAILLCDRYFPPVLTDVDDYTKLYNKNHRINAFNEKDGFHTLELEFLVNHNYNLLKAIRPFFQHFATTSL